jgi:hypothetical protein
MLSVAAWCRRAASASNRVRDTNTAVNTFDSRPKKSVVANPRIGPVPNWKRKAGRDERRDVRVENRQEHAVEAGVDGGLHALAAPPAPP